MLVSHLLIQVSMIRLSWSLSLPDCYPDVYTTSRIPLPTSHDHSGIPFPVTLHLSCSRCTTIHLDVTHLRDSPPTLGIDRALN
ncbi:hypothetical protein BDV39DRAFT_147650 [Aspergillus sergii]|uniref:Secreted protein n=1 Tax=Aspergillus sergii TaxID=1034303 RepID=A0A5N6XEC4_9EURO|nr:hypothetical protein BDV39DRAFT_147650 [Aspergillus sergii]